MSIEIEVGLENAAKVRPSTEELKLEPPPKGLANPKTRGMLFGGGIVLLAVIVGLFLYTGTAKARTTRRSTGTSRRFRRKCTAVSAKFW